MGRMDGRPLLVVLLGWWDGVVHGAVAGAQSRRGFYGTMNEVDGVGHGGGEAPTEGQAGGDGG